VKLHNKHVGDVAMSCHAWDRFKERHAALHPDYTGDDYALKQKINSFFAKAQPDKEVSLVRRLKHMRNYQLDSVYLTNRGAELRFIVSTETKTIITVEIAGDRKELNGRGCF